MSFLQNCRRFHCLVAKLDLVAMVTKVRNILSYLMFVCLKKNSVSSELRQKNLKLNKTTYTLFIYLDGRTYFGLKISFLSNC